MASLISFLLTLTLTLLLPCSLAASSCASETFTNNRVYRTCNDLPHLSSSLHFSYDTTTGNLSLAFVSTPASSSGWVAWAINPTGSGMIGSQALIAFKQSTTGSMVVKTYNVSSYGSIQESAIAYETSGLAAESGSDGKFRMFANVAVGKNISSINQVWQVGSSVTNGVPDQHALKSDNTAAVGKLDLVNGVSTGSAAVVPSDNKKNVHGILNAVSWGILIPLGAIIARYVKVYEVADPAWFYMHVSCQLAGYAIGVAGWATGLKLGKESKGVTYTTHRNIGIAIFALATVQLFALFLRPNKDHKYRLFWNVYHHSVGYSVIVLGAINIFRGLTILQGKDMWRTAYIVVICVLVGIAVILEAITWFTVIKRRRSNHKTYSNGNGHTQQQSFGV